MPEDQSIYKREEQGVSSFTRIKATVDSLIIVLLTLLQLKSENKDETPFETHGPVIMLFIVTLFIYAFVAVAAITAQSPLVPALNQISVAAGVLACDLLLLILSPPFGYFFLVLVLLVLLYYVFTLTLYRFLGNYAVYNSIKERFRKCYDLLLQAASIIQQRVGSSQTSVMNA